MLKFWKHFTFLVFVYFVSIPPLHADEILEGCVPFVLSESFSNVLTENPKLREGQKAQRDLVLKSRKWDWRSDKVARKLKGLEIEFNNALGNALALYGFQNGLTGPLSRKYSGRDGFAIEATIPNLEFSADYSYFIGKKNHNLNLDGATVKFDIVATDSVLDKISNHGIGKSITIFSENIGLRNIYSCTNSQLSVESGFVFVTGGYRLH